VAGRPAILAALTSNHLEGIVNAGGRASNQGLTAAQWMDAIASCDRALGEPSHGPIQPASAAGGGDTMRINSA